MGNLSVIYLHHVKMNDSPSFVQRLVQTLHSPIAGLVIGIVTTIFFFWLTDQQVELAYLASASSTTTAVVDSSQPVEGEPRPQTCSCLVAFWNQGKVPLTQDLLTAADPLRITASTPIRLLSIQTTRVSRPTLRFAFTTNGSVNQPIQDIFMAVKDDDALDAMDGAVFRIDYAGPCDTHFRVFGRVIGAGPILYRGEATRTYRYWYATPVLIPLMVILTIVVTGALVFASRESLEDMAFLPVLAIILWILLGTVLYTQPLRRPDWLPVFDMVRHEYHRNR